MPLSSALCATVLGVTCTVVAASADPTPSSTPVPSRQDVRDARRAVAAGADDVPAVQAALRDANERLQRSAIAAERAEEAYNGARYRAQQAARAARRAAQRAGVAGEDLDRQRTAYAATLLADSQQAPQLTALAALASADGIEALMQRVSTIGNAQTALDLQYQRFLAASALAKAAEEQARSTDQAAQRTKDEAGAARETARRSADAAATEAAVIAARKAALVRKLARLQDISVATAAARQHALEQAAAEQAASAASAAAAAAEPAAATPPATPPTTPSSSAPDPTPAADPQPAPAPDPPTQTSDPAPTPDPDPDPPAPSSGAQAAIAFARAQLGEPYVWGAAGPDSWDCSGLTMKAWAAGGRSLPHYSVAQYEQSTPIRASQLRPGDLVFWGDSSSPSSIYHVALYIGDGRILHAPRTGEPVQEASMYYWTPPNFYARP
ncbi:C40 family peptidase [Nocardioides panacihumi]|uniref:C40 family peptidase n=1 Tax=Nocardioides panacihumi TaxID=400774 RepID=UPI0031DB9363